jgi:hypothetical protein
VAGLQGNLLLLCETVTEELLELVSALSGRTRVAVACRSADDRWVPAAFTGGALACAAGVSGQGDLNAFASLILGYF